MKKLALISFLSSVFAVTAMAQMPTDDVRQALNQTLAELSRSTNAPKSQRDTLQLRLLYTAGFYYQTLGVQQGQRVYLDSMRYYGMETYRRAKLVREPLWAVRGIDLSTEYYFNQKDYNKAIGYQLEALQLAEQARRQYGLTEDVKAVLFMSHRGMSRIYRANGDWDQAYRYDQLTLQYSPYEQGKMFPLSQMGDYHEHRKEYAQAIAQYNAALDIAERARSSQRFMLYNRLAEAYLNLNQIEHARTLLEKASNGKAGTYIMATTRYLLAWLHLTQDQPSEALLHAQAAMAIDEKLGEYRRRERQLQLLYQIERRLGHTAEALAYHERYVALKDSLAEQRNVQTIAEMQRKYDIEKVTLEAESEKIRQRSRVDSLRRQYELNQLRLTAEKQHLTQNALATRLEAEKQQAIATRERERQKAEIGRLHISELSKDLALQSRTRNFLFAGVGLLVVGGVSLAWYNRRLQQKNQELTQKNREIEEALYKGQHFERKRVAIELHDNLSSLLAAAKLNISVLNPDNLSPQERKVYQNVLQMMDTACHEVRHISHGMVPPELEKEGLSGALRQMAERLNQSGKIKLDVDTDVLDVTLNKATAFNLYSICLELTNNIIKHARATEASVRFRKHGTELHLFVSDNGKGLKNTASQGIGLRNIRSRAEAIGASLDVQSSPDGTTFWLTVPLTGEAVSHRPSRA